MWDCVSWKFVTSLTLCEAYQCDKIAQKNSKHHLLAIGHGTRCDETVFQRYVQYHSLAVSGHGSNLMRLPSRSEYYTYILSVMGRDLISMQNLTACSCLLPKVSFYERYMEQQTAQDNITHILLAKYNAISSVTKLCFKHNFCCWHSSIHCLGSDLRHVQCHSLSVSW